jgi:hypothetical protein
MPEWFRWRTTKGPTTVFQAPDGVLCLKSPRADGLLELLPDPQQEHYRFSAEVRQESALRFSGETGIYFAYSNYSTAEGPKHFFASLTFDDNVVPLKSSTGPPKNTVRSVFHLLDEQYTCHRTSWQLGDRGRPFEFTPAVFDKGQGPWRKLAVEVRPERFDCFWEDQLVNSLRRREIIPKFKTFIDDRSVPEERIPQFAPRDSLGLYVARCEASFRRVMVEPLGDMN